jgi:hypothetical protein
MAELNVVTVTVWLKESKEFTIWPFKKKFILGMVAHACNPSTWKAEAEGLRL